MWLFALGIIACSPKKEYIITDAYVNKEAGGPASASSKNTLSAEDKKYFASKMNTSESQISNYNLYSFIREWEGSKYSPSGTSKKEISSAGLIAALYEKVYNRKVSNMLVDLYADKRIKHNTSTEGLKEGDLLFFSSAKDRPVTYVGIYLTNAHFFVASPRGGAAKIFDFNKGVWKKEFVTAGRFQQ